MSQIKLRFLEGKGVVPALIKCFCWSEVTHAEFIFPDGYLGACYPGGVAVRPFNYAHPEKAWYGTVEVTDVQAQSIEAFARAQIGKPYSLLGIFGFVVRHDFDDRKAFFCSELILDAFEQAGLPLLHYADMDRVTPAMLFDSPLITEVSAQTMRCLEPKLAIHRP